jgi:hypothetical protein
MTTTLEFIQVDLQCSLGSCIFFNLNKRPKILEVRLDNVRIAAAAFTSNGTMGPSAKHISRVIKTNFQVTQQVSIIPGVDNADGTTIALALRRCQGRIFAFAA